MTSQILMDIHSKFGASTSHGGHLLDCENAKQEPFLGVSPMPLYYGPL